MKKKSQRTLAVMLIVLVLVTVLAFTGLPLGSSKYYVASVGEALSKGLQFGSGYEAVYEYAPVTEDTTEETAEETAEEVVEEAAEETAEEVAEAAEEPAAEETVEEAAEETAEEVAEETAEETAEEVAEETAEETAEEVAEEPAAEESAEEPAEETPEEEAAPVDVAEAAKEAEKVIKARLNARGLYESKVTLNEDNTLTVQVPDYDQGSQMLSLLGYTGKVEFRKEDGTVILDKSDLKSAEPFYNNENSIYYALVHFTGEGRKKIAAATDEMTGEYMYVYLDDELFTYASISEKLDADTIYMPMAGSDKDSTYLLASAISMIINCGEIPVTFTMKDAHEIETTSSMGLVAAVIGIALAVLCMVYLVVVFKKSGIGAALGVWAYALIASYIAVGVGSMMNWLAFIALVVGLALYMYWAVIALKRAKAEIESGRSVDSSFTFAYKSVRPTTYLVALGAIVVAVLLLLVLKGLPKTFADTLWIGVVSAFVAVTLVGKPMARVTARI